MFYRNNKLRIEVGNDDPLVTNFSNVKKWWLNYPNNKPYAVLEVHFINGDRFSEHVDAIGGITANFTKQW